MVSRDNHLVWVTRELLSRTLFVEHLRIDEMLPTGGYGAAREHRVGDWLCHGCLSPYLRLLM
ncbi:MAG TPA: hypothetical protein VII03_01700, partial [Solirubrobacteraceae bacterium]